MNGKARLIAMVAVGLLAGLVVALFLMNEGGEPTTTPTTPTTTTVPFEATIFFPDENLTSLTPETIILTAGDNREGLVRKVIDTVTDPVRSSGLFPDGMRPGQLFAYDRTLVLGYGADFGGGFSGGAAEELLAVDALVDSLLRTFEAFDTVTITREGSDRFIRHVDLTEPFVYSSMFVVEAPAKETP